MPRTCPDCKTPLERKDFSGLVLDACPKCAGVFFDDGELADLRRRGDAAFTEVDDKIQPAETLDAHFTPKLRMCPGCGAAMNAFRYLYSSPVILDSCGACGGIWVDNGELKQMQEYLRGQLSGGVTRVEGTPPLDVNKARIAARAARYLAMRRQ